MLHKKQNILIDQGTKTLLQLSIVKKEKALWAMSYAISYEQDEREIDL